MKFMVSTGVYWEHLTEFRTDDGERCLIGSIVLLSLLQIDLRGTFQFILGMR